MQERGFASARRRDQRDRLSRPERKIGPTQDLYRRLAATEPPLHLMQP
jgi:hypothetical protein